MTRNHEKLLVATLAGIIIAGAAMFAIQPAIASSALQLGKPAYVVLTLNLGM